MGKVYLYNTSRVEGSEFVEGSILQFKRNGKVVCNELIENTRLENTINYDVGVSEEIPMIVDSNGVATINYTSNTTYNVEGKYGTVKFPTSSSEVEYYCYLDLQDLQFFFSRNVLLGDISVKAQVYDTYVSKNYTVVINEGLQTYQPIIFSNVITVNSGSTVSVHYCSNIDIYVNVRIPSTDRNKNVNLRFKPYLQMSTVKGVSGVEPNPFKQIQFTKTSNIIANEFIETINDNPLIPVGDTYISQGSPYYGDGVTKFPLDAPEAGDRYMSEDYIYTYSGTYWSARVVDRSKTSYSELKSSILGKPLQNLNGCYRTCTNLVETPVIPESVTRMEDCFSECISLKTINYYSEYSYGKYNERPFGVPESISFVLKLLKVVDSSEYYRHCFTVRSLSNTSITSKENMEGLTMSGPPSEVYTFEGVDYTYTPYEQYIAKYKPQKVVVDWQGSPGSPVRLTGTFSGGVQYFCGVDADYYSSAYQGPIEITYKEKSYTVCSWSAYSSSPTVTKVVVNE